MESAMILTAVSTVIAIIGSNIALILWIRSDVKSFEIKIDGWKEEINKEMKDFHGRLCVLDERMKERK